MSFFAVLFALLIEQLKPLPQGNMVSGAVTAWSRWAGKNLDAGRERHAWAVWLMTTVLPAALVWLVYLGLTHLNLALGFVWNVVVLYLTLGFRQFSHHYTHIREALEQNDESRARHLLSQWRRLDVREMPRTELLRHLIEHSLLAAHRHVYGVFFWFVLCASFGLGPAGAALYRLAEYSSRYWTSKSTGLGVAPNERLRGLSRRLFNKLDYLPARLTAFGFAVVGNFEEAVTVWRRDAVLWKHENEGAILAAAAGALGVQLGGSFESGWTAPDRSTMADASDTQGALLEAPLADHSTSGRPPEMGHLSSVVGLVWRSVILWMLFLALLSIAHLAG